MKTMQELKELQDLKNKMFPPKLEFGCEVAKKVPATGKFIEGLIFTLIDNPTKKLLKDIKNDKYKILGKPLTILDILRMLGEMYPTEQEDTYYNSLEVNYLYQYKCFECTYGADATFIGKFDFDLSKPLVKDQPKATIIQLNKMLCK